MNAKNGEAKSPTQGLSPIREWQDKESHAKQVVVKRPTLQVTRQRVRHQERYNRDAEARRGEEKGQCKERQGEESKQDERSTLSVQHRKG